MVSDLVVRSVVHVPVLYHKYNIMSSPIFLYIKTHNKTGLKYFGKTIKDPFTYYGSGKHWVAHLKNHGYDVSTEIYGCFYNKQECKDAAIEFSIKHSIVDSDEWANLRIEELDGGDTSKTQGYINSIPKIREHHKKSKWWNNGVTQTFSSSPPDCTYTRGRLPFNNVGAFAGAAKQKGKIWVNNSHNELMVPTDSIPDGYVKGRLPTNVSKFNGSKTAGKKWWNNGVVETMSFDQPADDFASGRLAKRRGDCSLPKPRLR